MVYIYNYSVVNMICFFQHVIIDICIWYVCTLFHLQAQQKASFGSWWFCRAIAVFWQVVSNGKSKRVNMMMNHMFSLTWTTMMMMTMTMTMMMISNISNNDIHGSSIIHQCSMNTISAYSIFGFVVICVFFSRRTLVGFSHPRWLFRIHFSVCCFPYK